MLRNQRLEAKPIEKRKCLAVSFLIYKFTSQWIQALVFILLSIPVSKYANKNKLSAHKQGLIHKVKLVFLKGLIFKLMF